MTTVFHENVLISGKYSMEYNTNDSVTRVNSYNRHPLCMLLIAELCLLTRVDHGSMGMGQMGLVNGSRWVMGRLAVDEKNPIHIHIHIHVIFAWISMDIHGYSKARISMDIDEHFKDLEHLVYNGHSRLVVTIMYR